MIHKSLITGIILAALFLWVVSVWEERNGATGAAWILIGCSTYLAATIIAFVWGV